VPGERPSTGSPTRDGRRSWRGPLSHQQREQVIGEPVSKPGDFIEFRAEMVCIVGLSNCPLDVLAPCNAYHCTPVKVEILE
jgi:uncharacterized protein YcgI (DUF1989 family)